MLLRPISAADDAEALHDEGARDATIWTYLPYGPFGDVGETRSWLAEAEASEDPLFFAVVPLPGDRPLGQASYLRAQPAGGSIEIGHIWFARDLRRTPASAEAILLLAENAFERLGYRRLEWSCNALNAASRRAAERFGFTFEGVARQAGVVKGRNRDTAWYSIVDGEWPAAKVRMVALTRKSS